MAHGYLGDGYGIHGEGDERADERERWRERDREERGWSRGNEAWRGGDRGMFGSGQHDRQDEDRWSSGGRRDDRSREDRRFSAHADDHYRSWRDRHMSELDRDYQDYCREREQQFHREFDEWRRHKHGNPQPLRTGMTQSGISHDPSGETQVREEGAPLELGADPTATATLGTNSGGGTRNRR
jgi:hypothetical protein